MEKKNNSVLLWLFIILTITLAGALLYTLKNREQIETFKVTFDYLENDDENKTITVVKGEKVYEPNEPKVDGLIFKSWYSDGSKYDFDEKITEDIKITANWSSVYKEYRDNPFNLQCYTRESVEANNYVYTEEVSVGDEIICYLGFETYNGDEVETLKFDLILGSGLELLEVIDDYDLDEVDGRTYTYIFSDPMEVNEAGGYVLKVINTDELLIDVANILFDIDEYVYNTNDFELELFKK